MVDRIVVGTVAGKEPDPTPTKTGEVVQVDGDENKGVIRVGVSEADVKPEETKPDRPKWLPEKFDTPEAMATAYAELEKKQGAAPTEAEVAKAVETKKVADAQAILDAAKSGDTSDLLAEANTEFGDKGFLSPETFAKLDKAGIPKARVSEYIEGRKAVAASQGNMLAEIAGSEEILKAVIQWSGANLTNAEADAYNNALDSGNTEALKLAFQGVFAKYSTAVGVDGDLVAGPAGEAIAGGARPFASQQEVIEAMSSKAYKTDPAERKRVEQRMAVSEMFGVK